MAEQTVGIGGYLARVPYLVGHELGPDQVVVGVFGPDRRAIAHAAVTWEPLVTDEDLVREVKTFLARALGERQIEHLFVIGYGPEGQERALLMDRELQDLAPDTHVIHVIHVQDDTWRARTRGGWSSAGPVPRDVVDLTLQGLPTPARSRAALVSAVAPLLAPLFGPGDPRRTATLDVLSPAVRARTARAALNQLAAGRTDDPSQMQVLAHLMTTDVVIRDAVLAHALADGVHNDRVDALVRTFRAAPVEQQPALATTAAATALLASWPPPPLVHGLMRYADPGARLTTLVAMALHSGIDPRTLRPGLVKAAEGAVQDAERVWVTRGGTAPITGPVTTTPPSTPPAGPPMHSGPAHDGPSL